MTGNRRRAAWGIVAVLSMALVVSVLVAVFVSASTTAAIRESQNDNTTTLDNTSRTLELLLDCTSPEGACYKRGQARTAKVVDDIGLLSAFAAACADRPRQQTAEEIQECVLDLLEASQRRSQGE